MERKRCTNDFWFRSLVSVIGISVVGMCRWHRNVKSKKSRMENSAFANEFGENYEAAISKFSDMSCARLADKKTLQHGQRKMINSLHDCTSTQMKLEKAKKYGSKTRLPAAKKIKIGRKVGTACDSTCFVCRKYLKKNGETMRRNLHSVALLENACLQRGENF